MKQNNPFISQAARLKRLHLLVVVAGIACAGALTWWLLQPSAVTVVPVLRGPAIQAVYATGTVEASITIRVAPQAAGRLLELKADEGQTVKAWDVLARLDDSDLRASVEELEARAKYAEQQFERAGALLKQGWATREKFDQAKSELDAARQSARRSGELLTFMSLRTPVDGHIIRRDGEVGDYIPVNQPVFYVAKAGVPLRISADVDEEDIPLVKIGQKVLIRADAFPARIFTGEVTEITPKGDPVARNYRVRVELPFDTALMIGMTAETNIVTIERENALLVPASAVSGTVLWVVRNGKAERVPAQIGIKGRDRFEIIAGLADDDKVVINPPASLTSGKRVRLRIATQSAAPQVASGGVR
ncbi:MAG: efflux RND transporter periplasmic adaptor subunit [Rhodomicrobium sp.]